MLPTPPFPNIQLGRGDAKLPIKPMGAAERHGTLRNLTERLNLAIPHWDPPKFGGLIPNSLIFFAPDASLFPTPKCERRRSAKLPTQTKWRGGTPRNATEPGGAPKFGYPELESAIVLRISPKLSNNYAPDAPFSQHTNGEGEGMRNYLPNKGAPTMQWPDLVGG